MVTNTNDNFRIINGENRPIPRLSHATAHARYVWEKYVMGCNPERVAIVAHSYGGAIAMDLVSAIIKSNLKNTNANKICLPFRQIALPNFLRIKCLQLR